MKTPMFEQNMANVSQRTKAWNAHSFAKIAMPLVLSSLELSNPPGTVKPAVKATVATKIDIIKRILNQCLIMRYLDRVLGFLDRILDPLMLMVVPAIVKAQSVNICKESKTIYKYM